MPIVGKYFPSQKSQEKVFLLLRRHWFTYFGFVAVAVIMSIPILALIIVWMNRPDYFSSEFGNIIIVAVFSYILFALAIMLYGFIDYYLDVYIVTNERIVNVEQNGFFRRKISELHLHQIQDVSAKVDGMLPTLLHYGSVYIQTAGERENFTFRAIPNPYRVSKLIIDLHETQIQEKAQEITSIEARKRLKKIEDEQDGGPRDALDMEMANLKLLSEVRDQTKRFLSSKNAEESNLSDEAQSELKQKQQQSILEDIDNKADHSFSIKGGDGEDKKIVDKNPKKIDKKQSGPNNKVVPDKQGEMKENLEIDI